MERLPHGERSELGREKFTGIPILQANRDRQVPKENSAIPRWWLPLVAVITSNGA